MTARDFSQLLTSFQAHLNACPPISLTPRSHADPGFGARTLSPRDRLLATIITQRRSASRSTLASIMGTSQPLITRAIRETILDLTAMGRTIPHAPIKATTAAALMALIDQTTTS
jgi:hypothetical protein